jgi:hypothetical protein
MFNSHKEPTGHVESALVAETSQGSWRARLLSFATNDVRRILIASVGQRQPRGRQPPVPQAAVASNPVLKS